MPIIRGFPPSNTISPSVRITEKDLSYYPSEQSFHRAGLVGFASKGPIDLPTLIGSKRQLNTIFGFPHPDVGDPYLIYAAEQYLLVASELYIVRVGDQDAVSDEAATVAQVNLPAAGGRIVIQSDTAHSGEGEEDYYSFDEDAFFRWKLNGVIASKVLSITAGDYTASDLAGRLHALVVPELDGIDFESNEDKIAVVSTFAYGPAASIELVSVHNAAYDEMGIGTGMLAAEVTGSATKSDEDDSYLGIGKYDLTLYEGLDLNVVIDGTNNVNIDNQPQHIDLSDLVGMVDISDIVDEINGQIEDGTIAGGFVAEAVGGALKLSTLHKGRDARLLVKSDSTISDLLGLDHITHRGRSPSGPTGDGSEVYGIVTGSANEEDVTVLTITAESAGVDGNGTKVDVINDAREGRFQIRVYNNGVEVESWGYLTMDHTSRYYVETYLSLVSDYVRAVHHTENGNAPPRDGVGYTLTGGADGLPSDPVAQDNLLIGSLVGQTGLNALSDPEQVDIDLVAIPGRSSTLAIEGLMEFCQNRGDCMGIVDPPFGLTVNEIVHWQNGVHPLNDVQFNSDFLALYWPWVKIRDGFNGINVWVPPSGSMLAVFARNDQLGAPWTAPAGAQRGIVPGILDVFSRPTLEERDAMYGNRNCVNPIVQFSDFMDFTVWGQKTMQRRPTALDRVNVRRLLTTLEKRVRKAVITMLFDPNDAMFQRTFESKVSAILKEVKLNRGLYDYIIKADAEINTPDVIDRNEFRARIGIQPVKAVEFIFIEFSVHRTGSWTETSDYA